MLTSCAVSMRSCTPVDANEGIQVGAANKAVPTPAADPTAVPEAQVKPTMTFDEPSLRPSPVLTRDEVMRLVIKLVVVIFGANARNHTTSNHDSVRYRELHAIFFPYIKFTLQDLFVAVMSTAHDQHAIACAKVLGPNVNSGKSVRSAAVSFLSCALQCMLPLILAESLGVMQDLKKHTTRAGHPTCARLTASPPFGWTLTFFMIRMEAQHLV